MRRNAKWLLFLTVAVILFYWKILFTLQFSIVEDWEAVNQGFAWHQFATRSIQNGTSPFWDPYVFSGRSHIGEMQPGLFYPLKLILYFWPLGGSRILSFRLFEQYYVLAHLLAAVFMFYLALEVGIEKRFAAFVSALCFSLGGFTGNVGGSQLWDSAIWLPLIFFCQLRALNAVGWERRILYASFAGLGLAMTVLAGSLHLPVMDAIVIVSAALFFVFQNREKGANRGTIRSSIAAAIWVVGIIGVVAFASAAVQLLPSIEYAPLVERFGAAEGGNALKRIPFSKLAHSYYLPPRFLMQILFPPAWGREEGVETIPYFGTMPFFLVIIGAWQLWRKPWVKFSVGMVIVSLAYTLAGYSFLYGLLYLFVPFLNMLREAERFIYLTHFAMALLAGFGVQVLFDMEAPSSWFLQKTVRALRILVVICLLAIGIPSIYSQPAVNEWWFVSLIFLFGTWAVFSCILQNKLSAILQFLMVALILWDLNVFAWLIHDRLEDQRRGTDYFEQLVAARPLADFFHSQPGLYRVHIEAQRPEFVNLGDMFGVQTTGGQAATAVHDYMLLLVTHSRNMSLLNVRYFMVPDKKAPDRQRPAPPVFSHGRWHVYENPSYCPRAWISHQAVVEPSSEAVRRLMEQRDFDPLRTAYVSEPLENALGQAPPAPEEITFSHYQSDYFELEANVSSAGLLVLSEIYFPGWSVTINAKPTRIHKVDSVLRGVEVSQGRNRIVMRYEPLSIRLGMILSAVAWLGILGFAALVFWKERTNTRRDRTLPLSSRVNPSNS